MAYKYGKQPRNRIIGKCAEAKKAEERGALDGSGKPSAKKYPGFTRPEPEVKITYDLRLAAYEQTSVWICNQDGSRHDSEATCFQNCKKRGLGGPIIVDCEGKEEWCVALTGNVSLNLEITTWALNWRTGCAEGTRWNKQIRDHEQRHRQDITAAAERWSQKHAGDREFKECGATKGEAIQALLTYMQSWRDTQTSELIKTFEADAETFHQKPEGRPAVLDCSKCRER